MSKRTNTNTISQFEPLLYSRREAAQLLGISYGYVGVLVSRGELLPKMVGVKPMFTRAELERFAGVSA